MGEHLNAAPEITHPALRYRGGKWRLAPWIVEHLPPHVCYVEPFAGAASVLFHKERSDFEVINDLDESIVDFFKVLRDRPQALLRAIRLTPFSRAEYKRALGPVPRRCKDPELERARRLYLRCWQGRGSSTADGGWRFQIEWNGWRMNTPGRFREIDRLEPLVARLSLVQVERGSALDIIPRFDNTTTAFYVDPPYTFSSRVRSARRLYRAEMEDSDHEALADVLHGVKGMVLLSGYPLDSDGKKNRLYERLYTRRGWKLETKRAYAEKQKETIEGLWINPQAQEALEAVRLAKLEAEQQQSLFRDAE